MSTTATIPSPSALTSLLSTDPSSPPSPTAALTTQILHNLQHQHLWISLRTSEPHTLAETQSTPLISGVPPTRFYTHPDEQAYMVEHGIREADVPMEREWVLPVAQGQSWSLRRLAEAFDALPELGTGNNDDGGEGNAAKGGDIEGQKEKLEGYWSVKKKGDWGGKRILLAMVNKGMGGDGTVVYYVVMEGTVKPRQH